MRLPILVTVALLAAAPAFAYHPSLTSNSSAGACGGSIGCVTADDRDLDPAPPLATLSSAAGSTLADGSYAHAHATASFGLERVYADAFRAAPGPDYIYGDAQAQGYAQFYDYAAPADIHGNNFNLSFAVNGFATPTDHVYGASAYAFLSFTIVDTSTGDDLAYGGYSTSDLLQSFTIARSLFVPTGHGIYLRVQFEADAYTNNSDYGDGVVGGTLPVVADYSNTLHVYVDPAGSGGSIAFASGHDYSTPAVAGIPEPATWLLMAGGFAASGEALRRRRAATA